MVGEQERQEIIDAEHLRLLPVFYWVLAPMDFFFSLYGFIYAGFGALMAVVPLQDASAADAPPAFMGWFFFAIGAGFILWFGGNGVMKVLAGIWIRNRQHRVGTMVAAGLACFSWPFGVVVGIFTFLVLSRPSVAAAFEART